MNPDVCPFLKIGFELVPEFRRLVFDIPFHVFVPGTEIALFGASWFLISAHPNNDPSKMTLLEDLFERVFLKGSTAFDTSRFAVGISHAAVKYQIGRASCRE